MAEALRGLLADTCQPADLRRLMESGAPRDWCRWEKIVELGLRNNEYAVVKNGLKPGTRVVLYPGDSLEDGRRIELSTATSQAEQNDVECREQDCGGRDGRGVEGERLSENK